MTKTKAPKFNDRFKHTETAAVIKSTEFFLERTAEEEEARSKAVASVTPVINDPDTLARKLADGFYVTRNLAIWCDELRKANPRLKFGMQGRLAWQRMHGMSVMHEVWAYVPEQPYAIMRLGYKDYRTSRSSDNRPQFGVYSRLIENNKYNCTNEQYAMSMTEDFDRAVAMAKKYLRPYAPHELIQVELGKFRGDVHNESSEKNIALSTAISNVRNSPHLLPELRALVDAGHEFKSAELRELVGAYIAARVERDAHMGKVRHGWFVSVYERNDKQYFDVIEMFDLQKQEVPKTSSPQTYDETTLPEELSGKLAVLMMNEKGHRVPDVGMRATDRTFYVERV